MPYVTDTHALVWYMTDNPQLSPKARSIFEEADEAHDRIYIPCIVFFELLYLTEKKKLTPSFQTLVEMMSSSENYRIEPMCLPIIERSRAIPRKKVPDPWDRLIAATSIYLNLPLITRDKSLRRMGLATIW